MTFFTKDFGDNSNFGKDPTRQSNGSQEMEVGKTDTHLLTQIQCMPKFMGSSWPTT